MDGWLISKRVDLGILILPAVVSVMYILTLPDGLDSPLWVYIAGVLMIDVAHVWASLYRCYLDREIFSRYTRYYVALPVLVGLLCFSINAYSESLFWTLMAYTAVHHFLRQQVGFSALYRLRQGLSFRSWDARVEKWAMTMLVLYPVLWWHVHLPRHYSWFMEGDFIEGLPSGILWPAGILTAGLLIAHIAFRIRSRLYSPGRDLWMLSTALVWFGGIIWTDGDLHFSLTNVVAHGLPYFALVFWISHRRWKIDGTGALRQWCFEGWGMLLPLGFLLLLAFLEEGAWDLFVWHSHVSSERYMPSDWLRLFAVGVLAVPQVTHYILDAFIWKGRYHPELRKLLMEEQTSTRHAIS